MVTASCGAFVPNKSIAESNVDPWCLYLQLSNLKGACGGMAAYTIFFAAKTTKHGREGMQTWTIASDDCLLSGMGFEVSSSADPQLNHHILGAVHQALAKEQDLRG